MDKKDGLDVEHYKRVLAKVAKWHAATLVIQERVSKKTENLILMCYYT